MNGRNVLGVDWDNESTDETVVFTFQGYNRLAESKG